MWQYIYPYVLDSWENNEGSIETDGIQALYILKGFMLVFIIQLFLQIFSEIIKNIHIYKTANMVKQEKSGE